MNREVLRERVAKAIYTQTTDRDASLVEFTMNSIEEQIRMAIFERGLNGKATSEQAKEVLYEMAIESIKVNP